MQFRSRFFDLLFNLAQSKTVSPTLVPIDFIVDDMKVETWQLLAAIWSIPSHRNVVSQHD